MHADGLITQLLYPAPKKHKPALFALSPGEILFYMICNVPIKADYDRIYESDKT